MAWFDIDQDGHEDLVIGSGRDGAMAVYLNNRQGQFRLLKEAPFTQVLPSDQSSVLGYRDGDGRTTLLAGLTRDESRADNESAVWQYDTSKVSPVVPGNGSGTGPVIVADIDGDGSLELFVGGRTISDHYPEPASSRIFRKRNNVWELDERNSRVLNAVGIVNGAVFSDLDGDGLPELVLACEWGPIRVFQNRGGILEEATEKWGLAALTGLWTGIAAGDIDGDGKLDLIAANWGENSPYRATPQQPLRLYYGDPMGRGFYDLIEAEFDPMRKAYFPSQRFDYLASGMPWLRERFSSFRAFSEASLDEILGDKRSRMSFREVQKLTSMVFLNRGGRFEACELPAEAQFAPAFSVNVGDANGDGNEDVFLSQNFFALPAETHRLDAGRGLWLQGDGTGKLRAVPGQTSGVKIYGEQRGAALADFDEDGRVDLAVTQNAASTRLFRNQSARPGLRVRLKGPPGNPDGIGAVIQIESGQGWGPAREIHGGSGYGSQDSVVQVMGASAQPVKLHVRWPGGKMTDTPLPSQARKVVVDITGSITARQ